MDALWSLPRAAPILLRHLNAYFELAAQDLAKSRAHFGARMGAAVLLVLGIFFAVLMICTAIIAANWDTPHRMTAIYSLVGFFVLIAIFAGYYAAHANRSRPRMFASVRREWEIDRVILERIIGGHDTATTGAQAKDK
jgi:uncharacterized membrane protein YqjE